jgi:predicted transport protein
VPAADLDAWLAARPPQVRDVVQAVRDHVDALGADVRLEATRDAVMVKRARTFAEVKPRKGRVEVSFVLARRLADPRVVRTLDMTRTRIAHTVDVTDGGDVDAQLTDWLTEAYTDSPA